MHPLDKINTERLTIRDVREGLGDGCSAVALAERHYTCIEETDPSVHAWLSLSRERAMGQAEQGIKQFLSGQVPEGTR